MPQFDFVTFYTQGITLTIAIAIFYFTYLKFILTTSFETLRFRDKILLSVSTVHIKAASAKTVVNKILTRV